MRHVAAMLILGRSMRDIDWTTAVVTGLLGSFVGGLGLSLATGGVGLLAPFPPGLSRPIRVKRRQ